MLTVEQLGDGGFDTVIVGAPDFHGRLFGKRIPAERFARLPDEEPNICTVALAYDVTETNLEAPKPIPFAGLHTGWHDVRLRPDLTTLRPYPALAGTATCLADIVDELGTALDFVPRALLRAQTERAREAGYEVLLGSELEFYVFQEPLREARRRRFRGLEPTTLVHSDHRVYGQASLEPFMARIRREMGRAGIPVAATQAEYGLGQWEVNLDHTSALEMCDRHLIYKDALKEMAIQEDFSLTFMARPMQDDPGSSCHFHCSLRTANDEPVFPSTPGSSQLSKEGRSFLAGLMSHLDETALFFAPYVNSYKRHAIPYSGAVNAWGVDNRTLAFRIVGAGPSLRIEHRYGGADLNPYLAAAAIIAAGLDGIERELDPGASIVGNAYEQPELAKSPQSLGRAIELFEESDFVASVFGKEAVSTYGTHAHHEWERYLSDVTEWELIRAFELA